MKCSSCGTEIKEGAEFCVVCGKKLPKRKKCPNCGAEVLEDVMFCTNCGNMFEQKAESVAYDEEEKSSNPWKWVAISLIAMLLVGGAYWYFYMMPQNTSENSATAIPDSAQISTTVADSVNEVVSKNNVADKNQDASTFSFEGTLTGKVGGFTGSMYICNGTGHIDLKGSGKRDLKVESIQGDELVINAYLKGKYIGYYSGNLSYDAGETYKGVFYNTSNGGKVNFDLHGN